MTVAEFIIFIYVAVGIGLITAGFIFIRKDINRSLDIKEKEIKNKEYELFNSIDVDKINENINAYIEHYINRYILYKFISQKVMYINSDDTETLIRDVTKNIVIDLSELYIYYIKLIYPITDDTSLITFIKNRVTNSSIEIVTSYNSSMIPEE